VRSSIWTLTLAFACSVAACYGDHGKRSNPTSRTDGSAADAAASDGDVVDAAIADAAIADATVTDAGVRDGAAADAAGTLADAGQQDRDASTQAADSGPAVMAGAGGSDTDDAGVDEPVSAAAARLRKIIGSYEVVFIGHVGSVEPQPVEPPANAAVAGDVQFSHSGSLTVAPGELLPIKIPDDAQFAFGVQSSDVPKGAVAIQNPLGIELATAVVGPPGTFELFTDMGFHPIDGVPDRFESCTSGEPFKCSPVFRPQNSLPPPPAGEIPQPAWMIVHVDGDADYVHVVAELIDRGGRPDYYGARALCTATKLPDGSDSWNQLPFALHATIELSFEADGGVSGTIKGRARAEDGTVSGEALFEAMITGGVKRLPTAQR
jgi:hypothetical protein